MEMIFLSCLKVHYCGSLVPTDTRLSSTVSCVLKPKSCHICSAWDCSIQTADWNSVFCYTETLLSSFSEELEEMNSDSVSYDCVNTWGLSHCPLLSRPALWEQHKTKTWQPDAFFSSPSPLPKSALPGCCLFPSWEQCLSGRNVFLSRDIFPL